MNRVRALAFAALWAAYAVGASAAGVAVGIVLPAQDEPRLRQDEARFQALKDAGYNIELRFSRGDPAQELADVNALLAQGMKVLIICPQDGDAAAACAKAAAMRGAKVISYDRMIRDSVAVDYFVTFDSVQVGASWGEYLVRNAAGKGNSLFLYSGATGDPNANLYLQGAWRVLQPRIANGTFLVRNSRTAARLKDRVLLTHEEEDQIIEETSTHWNAGDARTRAANDLSAARTVHNGTAFVCAPNDETARAIAPVFAAWPEVQRTFITGQDAEPASIQAILDGKQSMTVLKDVRSLVVDAISATVTFLKGGTPTQSTTFNNGKIYVPANPTRTVAVTRDNLEAAIFDSGYYAAGDFRLTPRKP